MKQYSTLLLAFGLPLFAQESLSLKEAVRTALANHPALEAARARVAASGTQELQARSAWLPKLNYQESVLRSNNPVFVFGGLLTQRRFTEANFAISSLNRPDFLNNFQSQLIVDQTVYDAGKIREATRQARLGHQLSAEQERQASMNLIALVARNYHAVVLAVESLKVAEAAVKSAEADLTRARNLRDAGLTTDADVLSIQVHLAAAREREIERRWAVDTAWAALNQSLGLPLDRRFQLTTPLAALALPPAPIQDRENAAVAGRPEVRQARLSAELADSRLQAARGSYWPQVGVQGLLETDRGRPFSQAGANWFFGVTLRWNLFNGYADRERIHEASHQLVAARAQQRESDSSVRLEVRQANAALQAAQERIQVAEAAVAQAEESARITRNRYEAGLATVTDLLRTETALLDASTRRLAAIFDQRVAATMLELASGALTGDSDVLQ